MTTYPGNCTPPGFDLAFSFRQSQSRQANNPKQGGSRDAGEMVLNLLVNLDMALLRKGVLTWI